MSLWDALLDFLGFGDDTTVTAVADASTLVEVSPEITTISIIDMQPVADVFDQALNYFREGDAAAADAAEAAAIATETDEVRKAENFRLALSIGALSLAWFRK